MSDLMSFTGLDDIVGKLDAFSDEAKADIKQLYGAAGSATFIDSQGLVPVDEGDLRDSAHMDATDDGDTFSVEVTYGDGNGYGSKYGEMDGYAWFTHEGHLSRGGNPVPGVPYLGMPFDQNSQNLMGDLKDLLS